MNMNITLIDADPILWKGDKNIRLINLTEAIRKIYKMQKQDQIFLIGGFNENNLFLPTLTEVARLSGEMNMEMITSYSELEEKNVYGFGLMHMLYQSFMAQENITDNTYTVVCADTNFLKAAEFFEKVGGNKVNFVLTDDINNLAGIKETYNVPFVISVDPKKRSIFDNTIIREILRIVKWGQENDKTNSLATLAYKCEKYSKIAPYKTLFIARALIHNGYLERQLATYNDKPLKIVVLGNPEKVNALLEECS